MSETHAPSRFLSRLGLLTAAGAACAVALVAIIDPYGLYRLVEQPGFNQVKPQLKRHQREIKTELARAAGIDTLIIGNSRAEIGFDPRHPRLAGAPAFNLALAGTRLVSARSALASLRERGQHPRKLIIGVDFLDFLVDPQAPLRPTAAPPVRSRLAELQWRFDAAFSIDSVGDALATLRLQRQADPESMTAQGFNPFYDYRKLARDEGYYPLFQQRAGDYAKRFAARAPSLYNAARQSAVDAEHLQAILEQAAQDGAETEIVIYPYHAQIMALFEQAGMMAAFEEWKALLAVQVDAVRASHGGVRMALWDFSGYSSYQCEPIPAAGDRRGAAQWYWEAGHFKSALGDLMLERMLARPQLDAGFGFPLTGARVGENRARVAQERALCAAAYPALFEATATLWNGVRSAP